MAIEQVTGYGVPHGNAWAVAAGDGIVLFDCGYHDEGSLGQSQAEQLLNSAAREERDVQGKKQRQSAPDQPRVGKDW